METPEVLYKFPDYAGQSFQPSNGTEGIIFMDSFCDQCLHQNMAIEKFCDIAGATMCFSPGDPEYPKEWIYNEKGWPVCTNWQKWDWGSEDDGWNAPPEPEPEDPNQLVLFSVADDVLQNHKIREKETAFN